MRWAATAETANGLSTKAAVRDRKGGQRRGRQRQGEGAGQLALRPAELVLHRYLEDGEGVVEHAPGDRLGDGEDGDDRPAVALVGAARAHRRSSSLFAAAAAYTGGSGSYW